jgi:hypothetical protein
VGLGWREFQNWRCEACGTESVILERETDSLSQASTFARACPSCGRNAVGTTIRPAQIEYRVVRRATWRPERRSRHTH